ncbi:MAG: hypothetical protein JWP45_2435 [Mucilaginibacter sp.]|nr:hypothetical protein [Mucilaginibacter sp.]MDB5140426.1 hypothetical protein [Mucilaginibacter sp.]
MDHFREIKNTLTWHNEGKFEVELVNGIIKKLNFCEPGKGPDDSGKSLTSTNYKFLQSVYNCLGDLFTFIEEENKRLGYRYAREGEIPQRYHEEITEDTYPMLADSKIRPINNYANQSESTNAAEENNDLIRDIG